MKKLLLAGALLFCAITTVFAQNRQAPAPEERAKRQAESLARRLTLTDDQKSKVQELFLKQAKTTDSLRAAAAEGNFQGMRAKLQPVQEATDKKIVALLNDDQKKQFQAYQEERKSRMPGRRPANK